MLAAAQIPVGTRGPGCAPRKSAPHGSLTSEAGPARARTLPSRGPDHLDPPWSRSALVCPSPKTTTAPAWGGMESGSHPSDTHWSNVPTRVPSPEPPSSPVQRLPPPSAFRHAHSSTFTPDLALVLAAPVLLLGPQAGGSGGPDPARRRSQAGPTVGTRPAPWACLPPCLPWSSVLVPDTETT